MQFDPNSELELKGDQMLDERVSSLTRTPLHERVKERINKPWRLPETGFLDHICIFDADFSETNMKFSITKAMSHSC